MHTKGHENFQPIDTNLYVFGPEIDRFSALIIYISLCALANDHTLWERCSATENCLLLGRDDFEHLGQSRRFALLYQESQRNATLRRCLDELLESHGKRMPRSLSEILNIYVDGVPSGPSIDTDAPMLYQGAPPPVPVDWAIDATPASKGSSSAPLNRPIDPGTAPIISSIPASGSLPPLPSPTTSSSKQMMVPPSLPGQQAARMPGWIKAALIILAIVIILVIIYFVAHQQLSSASFVLLMELSPLPIHVVQQQERDKLQERYADDEA